MSFNFSASTILVLFSLAINGLAQSPTAPSPSSSRPLQTHIVTVGKATNSYDPDTIEALPGDQIVFQFFPTNHSVVRAAYGYPCIPYEDVAGVDAVGFSSGHFPLDSIQPDPPTWNLTVNDTVPVFFYCTAVGSCINFGMVGVINPSATQILSKQKALAESSDYMLEPGQPFPEEAASSMSLVAATATVTSVASAATTGGSAFAVTTSHSGLSGGAIAGVVIGGVAVLLLAAALFYYIGRNGRLKQALTNNENRYSDAIAGRASFSPPPPPAKDMTHTNNQPSYQSDHKSYPTYAPSSLDVPPYSYRTTMSSTSAPLGVVEIPSVEDLRSVNSGNSPRMSPRAFFTPGPRYTPAREAGGYFPTGASSDLIPVSTVQEEEVERSDRTHSRRVEGPHEMDAS